MRVSPLRANYRGPWYRLSTWFCRNHLLPCLAANKYDYAVGALVCAIMVAYWPGVPGAALTLRYAALLCTLPWLALRQSPPAVGLAFLAYVTASISWSLEPWYGVGDLLHFTLLWLAFTVGRQVFDERWIWRGAAVGLAVSSVLAVAQWMGAPYAPPCLMPRPCGLWLNGNIMAETATLVVVGLLSSQCSWLWAAICIPALTMPLHRGSILALSVSGVLFLCRRRQPGWTACLGLLGIASTAGVALVWITLGPGGRADDLAAILHSPGVEDRLRLWQVALEHLSLFGSGAGSAYSLGEAEFMHNDWLQLLYEFGLGTGLVAPLAWSCRRNHVCSAYAVLALVGFPLFMPATGLLAALAAGTEYRRRRGIGDSPSPVRVDYNHGFY